LASTDFKAVVEDALAAMPDIVLLDLNLPYVDGHVVCRELREHSDVPIIVVTSRDSDLDELMSMNLGADDYITKPYSPQILLARIASVLRRADKTSPSPLVSYGGIELDPTKSQVSYGGQSAELTKNEMRILQVLMQRAEGIVSREEMQHELWQSDQFIDDNTLTVNVNRLRATLARIGVAHMLHTKRGLGYYLKSEEASS
jgi:DNA-binding response OmpR family regulator